MAVLEKAIVVVNRGVARELYEMKIEAGGVCEKAQPGQFVHVRPGATYDPLLRRPLSLYDVDKKKGVITLLYKVVGRGTGLLTRVKSREYVDIMGPLGNGFTLPDGGLNCCLVGGGVGVAPLVYLARVLHEKENTVRVLYGVASYLDAAVYEGKFAELGVNAVAATMDGSLGRKGTVIDLLHDEAAANKIDMIYTCGPEKMMTEVVRYADKHGIKGEVSLEEYMACGVGACLGCARRLKPEDSEYVKVCKDGPVFAIKALPKG